MEDAGEERLESRRMLMRALFVGVLCGAASALTALTLGKSILIALAYYSMFGILGLVITFVVSMRTEPKPQDMPVAKHSVVD